MTSVTYHLRDRGDELRVAWQRHFAGVVEVVPATSDIFGVAVDAVVSPANCFGFMDGGIDRVYSERFGWHIQDQLAAPTMRAPVSVAQTLNAYLAFRAVLRAVRRHNEKQPGSIRRVACPGLGTGRVRCRWRAKQMRAAWDEVEGGQPFQPTGVNDTLMQHYRLLRDE